MPDTLYILNASYIDALTPNMISYHPDNAEDNAHISSYISTGNPSLPMALLTPNRFARV